MIEVTNQASRRRETPRLVCAVVVCAMVGWHGFVAVAGAGPVPGELDDSGDAELHSSIDLIDLAWRAQPLGVRLSVPTTEFCTTIEETRAADWRVKATRDIFIPGAAQMRLLCSIWSLPGDEGVDGAMFRITSLVDGGTQTLGHTSMKRWSGAPAYFNGDVLRVEILVKGDAHLSSDAYVQIDVVQVLDAGVSSPYSARSICGLLDDRVLETSPIVARLMPTACTATIIDDANGGFFTAGHCGPASGIVVQFNVPLSSASGNPIAPPPEDQYPVDVASIQRQSLGTGQDWSYFGVMPNATGLIPLQRQATTATRASAAPTQVGTPLRITGYGIVSAPINSTWNFAQKTHSGPLATIDGTRLRHSVDTTGANSGSAIMLDDGSGVASRRIVGIHTHAGCSATGGSNIGTAIQAAPLQAAVNAPLGVTGSGTRVVLDGANGSMWVAQDLANNVGVLGVGVAGADGAIVNTQYLGQFDGRVRAPAVIQAIAFDASLDRVLAIANGNLAYTINPRTNEVALLGTVHGPLSEAIDQLTGAAIVPIQGSVTGQWLAIAQTTGTIYAISPVPAATGVLTASIRATLVPLNGQSLPRIGSFEYDATNQTLLALDDQATLGTRLIQITLPLTNGQPATWQVVGALGAGATDCNALARTPDGRWLTIDSPTSRLLSINRATGQATLVSNLSPMGASFVSGLGMAWVDPQPTASVCIADVDGSGGVDGFDVAIFFTLFEAGEAAADLDNSGGIDTLDIAAYFAAFEQGC